MDIQDRVELVFLRVMEVSCDPPSEVDPSVGITEE
jgi:hypothetical protein